MYFYALLKFCSASLVIRHRKYANYITFFKCKLYYWIITLCVLWLFYRLVKKNTVGTIIMSMFVCRIEEQIVL